MASNYVRRAGLGAEYTVQLPGEGERFRGVALGTDAATPSFLRSVSHFPTLVSV